jgi:hypothetical protein
MTNPAENGGGLPNYVLVPGAIYISLIPYHIAQFKYHTCEHMN